MAHKVPVLRTVALTQNTNHNLHTLLLALDSDISVRCAGIQIQFDFDGGASRLFITNDGISDPTADRGVELSAAQAFSMSFESNIIMLTQIVLRTNGSGLGANIVLVVR